MDTITQLTEAWTNLTRAATSPAFAEQLEERSGVSLHRSALVTLWRLVNDGPQRGGQFTDRVMLFPPNDRSRYFAVAVGSEEASLMEKLPKLTGVVVTVRRRRDALPDGTEKFVHHYYPKRS